MTTTITPAQDLAARWLPDPQAVDVAAAVLAALPEGDYLAAIPMYQPGKTHGIWVTGQEVVTVPGAIFWGINSFTPDAGVPSYGWARNAAAETARTALAGRPGTTAWASVARDGHVAVFEDF